MRDALEYERLAEQGVLGAEALSELVSRGMDLSSPATLDDSVASVRDAVRTLPPDGQRRTQSLLERYLNTIERGYLHFRVEAGGDMRVRRVHYGLTELGHVIVPCLSGLTEQRLLDAGTYLKTKDSGAVHFTSVAPVLLGETRAFFICRKA